LMGGLLHLVQRGVDWAGPLHAVLNATVHPPTTSVSITVLLCGLSVPIKGLTHMNKLTTAAGTLSTVCSYT